MEECKPESKQEVIKDVTLVKTVKPVQESHPWDSLNSEGWWWKVAVL